MDIHKNARLTPHSRAGLVRRELSQDRAQMGLRTRLSKLRSTCQRPAKLHTSLQLAQAS